MELQVVTREVPLPQKTSSSTFEYDPSVVFNLRIAVNTFGANVVIRWSGIVQ